MIARLVMPCLLRRGCYASERVAKAMSGYCGWTSIPYRLIDMKRQAKATSGIPIQVSTVFHPCT